MPPLFNSFRPGNIVTPGMFPGRVEQLQSLGKVLFQTKNQNPQHFLLHGERGIGESSPLYYLQLVARGDLESLDSGWFKFLPVSIELEPSNTYADIIRKIGAELQRTISSHQKAMELARSAWDFIKCWEVMGVKYSAKQDQSVGPHELLENLTYTFERTLENLAGEFDGILILVDEADKPPVKASLGEFVKVFTERLGKRGCSRVALGLAGLSGIIQKVRQSHESAPRIFEVFTLEPLKSDECIDVVRKGLVEAKTVNATDISISPKAESMITSFSEGYPHFIQQFAYSAFDANKDQVIDDKDVLVGAIRPNGAFQQLGLKYYEELYFDQIGSDEYRQVLRIMSDQLDDWVDKKDICKASGLKETTLNNAISALKKRNIIVAKPGTKGTYRLPAKSFAAGISAYTKAKETAAVSA